MKLTSIMPWGQWVEFEKEFNERTGLNCCLIDEDGVRITAYHQWANMLCTAIRGDKRGRMEICDRNKTMVEHLAGSREQMVVSCCPAGMVVACLPVYSAGKLVGLVGGCGMLPDNGSIDEMAVATPTGLSVKKIHSLVSEIGVLRPREIQALGNYLLGRLTDIMDSQPLRQGGTQ